MERSKNRLQNLFQKIREKGEVNTVLIIDEFDGSAR
jgi:hypothetical protein